MQKEMEMMSLAKSRSSKKLLASQSRQAMMIPHPAENEDEKKTQRDLDEFDNIGGDVTKGSQILEINETPA